jgi:hypothetical protein
MRVWILARVCTATGPTAGVAPGWSPSIPGWERATELSKATSVLCPTEGGFVVLGRMSSEIKRVELEAGLLFDEFRSESNVSEPCRSSVGVYLPFKLLDKNPPGPMERGVPVHDGCFAIEAFEFRRVNEELVTFTVLS